MAKGAANSGNDIATALAVAEIPSAQIPDDLMDWVAGFADCRDLVFLDSAKRHPTLGRYSFIAADPIHRITAEAGRTTIDDQPFEGSPFDAMRDLLTRYPVARRADLPPFQTGLAGAFGYGLRHEVEAVPRHDLRDHGFPDLQLGYYDV
ncbi:MAG TPA: hypothetical protein VGM59_05495, partial [Dongiaceae bacterium]